MGPDAMILVFSNVECKARLFALLFHLHQETLYFLFAFCHKGGVICMKLLIFLPAILILAWALSSLVFHMMHSAYQLNKQGDNIQPWCTPFPIWNQSVVPCLLLLLLDLHTDFSGGRSGGLVFPSLEEFSTVIPLMVIIWADLSTGHKKHST